MCLTELILVFSNKHSIRAIAVNNSNFYLVNVNQGMFWCVNCFVTSLELSMATMFSKSV